MLPKTLIFLTTASLTFSLGCAQTDNNTGGGAAGDTDTGDTDQAGGDTETGDSAAGDQDVLVGDALAAGTIGIYVAGDLTPEVIVDGLAGQTPRNYEIAISRYEILTAANDPNPVLCFEHVTPVVADMSGDTLVGTCSTSVPPSGDYTHGRSKVEWARYTVDGTLHGVATTAGEYTFFRAYSDTTYNGTDYLAGQGTVTFDDGTNAYEIPWVFLDLPSGGGVVFETVAGEMTMTFPFTNPLPIVQNDSGQHWARFHWHIFESFRWQDLGYVGYVDAQWDTSTVTTLSEIVWVPGVIGYHITSSAD